MKNNEVLTQILDELRIELRILNQRNARRDALDKKIILNAVYGKPETGNLVTLCQASLYSTVEGHGTMRHKCKLPYKHARAHMTSMYGTEINWYNT